MADTAVVTCGTAADQILGIGNWIAQQLTPSSTVHVYKIQFEVYGSAPGSSWRIGVATNNSSPFSWVSSVYKDLAAPAHGVNVVTLPSQITLTGSTSYWVAIDGTIAQIGMDTGAAPMSGGTTSGLVYSGGSLGTSFHMPFVLYETIVTATPVADFTATPLSGNVPLSVAFTDTSTNTPTSWAWTFGDGGTSSSQNPTHNYTTTGTFTVSLVATNAGGSDTETKTAYISAAYPTGTFTTIKFGTNLTVTDEGGGVIRVDAS